MQHQMPVYLLLGGSITPMQMCDKFVIIRSGMSLLAVDQHAADERVQLELLQQGLASAVGSRATGGPQGDKPMEQCKERSWRLQQDPLAHFELKQVERVLVSHRQKLTALQQKVCLVFAFSELLCASVSLCMRIHMLLGSHTMYNKHFGRADA
jgi:hypothetical protein